VGSHQLGFILWGTNNSTFGGGVFGLWDYARSQMIWNTNNNGDMFFSIPYSAGDWTGGSAAAAKILANGNIHTVGNMDAVSYSASGVAGASGTFTTADSKTVTVHQGLITAIV
jgi:hypothetical protein